MFVDDFFENIPNDRLLVIHHLLGGFNRHGQTTAFKLIEDEGLEQFQRHQFRQTALMQAQVRTHRNHRTTGVVDAFTQEVLTETTALTFDHVSQGLQRTLGRTGHGFTTTTVIKQAVNGLLKHALFVTDDDVRSLQFEQALQTIVTVNHTTVQIVQIGGRKAATVQRHQRTQIRRQHRQYFQNHPLRLNTRALEAFQHLQALGEFLDLRIRSGFFQLLAQGFHFMINVNRSQHFANGFSAHHGLEVRTELLNLFQVFIFSEQLSASQVRHAGINDAIGFKIKHAFDVTQRNIEHHAHARRQAL